MLGRDYVIKVQKSLRIEGIQSTPYISCFSGFHFQNVGREPSIVLSGIVFVQTRVLFEDCNLVQVLNCSFREGSALTVRMKNSSSTHLDIQGFSFFHTSCVKVFTSKSQKYFLKVTVSDTTFQGNRYLGLGITDLGITTINIYIYNCLFLNNACDIFVQLWDPTEISFTIRNTIFTSKMVKLKAFGIFFSAHSFKKVNSSVVELVNVTLESRPSNVFQMTFFGKKSLKIQRSVFKGGICLYKYVPSYNPLFAAVGTGALTILSNHDKLNRSGCVEKQKNKNIHPLWNYDTEVIFEDTIFEENAGLIAGAVYISNGNVTFNRCTFRNNFATKRSGHVYSAYGTGRVNFKDCSFLTTMNNLTVKNTIFDKSTFLYSESGGPIKFENTSMVLTIGQRTRSPVLDISNGGYVDVDNRSKI